MLSLEDKATILKSIQAKLPTVVSIYLFGSHATGDANEESDIDLAVLSETPLDPIELRSATSEILLGTQNNGVDLVDLRRIPLTLAMEILNSGEIILDREPTIRARHEVILMSLYTELNFNRKEILEDIQKRGSVHGR